MIDEKVLNSPIRWAGSKKKILNEMLSAFKKEKENYVECFLGSGVVLINVLKNKEYLKYKKFYVNDINTNIISFYTLLKDNPDYLVKEINTLVEKYNNYNLDEQEKMYYKIRDEFNQESDKDTKAVLFYFLMKTGFNGVYRENRLGKFNVPYGRKSNININSEYLIELSKLIQPVEFYNMDFESFLLKMKQKKVLEDSFLYFDPPYLPDDLLVNQKQELYTNNSFDHVHFFKLINDLKCKNVMISMSDSKSADKIYLSTNFEKKNMKEILRTINPKKLFPSTEVAFVNYEISIENEEH